MVTTRILISDPANQHLPVDWSNWYPIPTRILLPSSKLPQGSLPGVLGLTLARIRPGQGHGEWDGDTVLTVHQPFKLEGWTGTQGCGLAVFSGSELDYGLILQWYHRPTRRRK